MPSASATHARAKSSEVGFSPPTTLCDTTSAINGFQAPAMRKQRTNAAASPANASSPIAAWPRCDRRADGAPGVRGGDAEGDGGQKHEHRGAYFAVAGDTPAAECRRRTSRRNRAFWKSRREYDCRASAWAPRRTAQVAGCSRADPWDAAPARGCVRDGTELDVHRASAGHESARRRDVRRLHSVPGDVARDGPRTAARRSDQVAGRDRSPVNVALASAGASLSAARVAERATARGATTSSPVNRPTCFTKYSMKSFTVAGV